MKKTLSTLVLVSVLSAATLVGCGGNSGDDYNLPEVNIVSLDTLKATTTTIKFWHPFGSSTEAALQNVVADFETAYPYIDVELETKGGYDNLKQAVTLEIPTGNTPNVVLGYPDHFAEYLAGEVLVPLNDFIDAKDSEIGLDDFDDIYANYMVENQQFYEGYTFGLPFNKSTEVLTYNKTFFDAHNLKVPETWAEYRSVSEQILTIVEGVLDSATKIDAASGLDFSGVTLDTFYPASYDSAANMFITITRQWGGEYTSVGETFENGKILFENDKTKEAVQFFKDMYEDHLFATPATWEQDYASNVFVVLGTMMSVGSSAGVTYNVPSGDLFEVGVAKIPYYTADKASVIQQGTNIAMLANGTDNQKLASWLLIKYLTSTEGNTQFAIDSGYLPVRKSGTESSAYQALMDSTGITNASDLVKIASKKVAPSYFEGSVKFTAFTDSAFIGSSDVRTVVGNIIPAVTEGEKTVDQAIAEAVAQLPNYK
ncbi:MAG: extracellular solute-binding protein [Bacilli bacterium]